ncbi:hypothetical protein PSAC2689_150088 [Paraburkholderia sacchari]
MPFARESQRLYQPLQKRRHRFTSFHLYASSLSRIHPTVAQHTRTTAANVAPRSTCTSHRAGPRLRNR